VAEHLPHGSLVQDVVARADRQRRGRAALARVVRIAPWTAGLALLVAAAGRLAGAPPVLAVVAVALLAGVLAAWFLALRGAGSPPDVTATRIDADAGLAGELRSAHWFARHPDEDAWTAFHIERAAAHAGACDWSSLYPPVRARRTWLLTASTVAAALVLAVTTPVPDPAAGAAGLAEAELVDQALLDMLPPELRAQLEALLKQMAEGGDAGHLAEASLAELREMMKNVDPELSARLAEMLKDAQEAGELAAGGEKPPEAGAEMARDTSAGLPEDVRWAVDDLAERLANASRDRQTNESNPAASEETGETGAGSEQAAAAQGANAEAQMKMTREAATDPGASKMMMGGAGAMGGDSRPGAGGNNAGRAGNAPDPLSIAQALRQELVEASADARGKNVEKEDIRRQTEQGDATVGFTRVAPPSTVDRSRAQAPPIVPDARRALLFRYFTREK
jgi:hypothetical protein